MPRALENIRHDALAAYVANVDEGTGDGSMEFYTGTPPASLGDAPGETLLAAVSFAATAFAAPSGGAVAAASVPLSNTAAATGTIGWFRVLNGDDVAQWDSSDVATSGPAECVVNTLSVTSGGTFTVDSYTISLP